MHPLKKLFSMEMIPFLFFTTVAISALITPLSASAVIVSASDGEFDNRVLVEWTKDEQARDYTVHRCVTSDANSCESIGKRSLDDPLGYNDFQAEPLVIYHYRVTACYFTGCAFISDADTGYRAGVEEDDFGDNCSEATLIGENSSTIGNLETGSDSDYFRIELLAGGELIVSTEGDTDTSGVLKNSNCSDISSDDNGGAGSNYLIRQRLEPGTYYVVTRGQSSATGQYQLNTRFIPNDDFGNSCADATQINPNSVRDGSLETVGDLDYFRIELSFPGNLMLSSFGVDTFGTLKDANCSTIMEGVYDDPGLGNIFIAADLGAGTYYLETRGSTAEVTGSYQIQSEFLNASDDHANNCTDATMLNPNGSAFGVLEAEGDYDYFRVTITERGTLQLTTTGDIDTYGALFNPGCTDIMVLDDDSGVDRNFLIEVEVIPGDYTIVAYGYANIATGPYEIFSSFTAAGDTGDSCELARPIGANDRLDDELEVVGDLDYFRLDLNVGGTLRLNSTSSIDMFGVLKNANCETIAVDDDTGENLNFMMEVMVDPGTYYLEASGFGSSTGAYVIETGFVPVDNVGGSCEAATDVTLDSVIDAAIGSAGDHDFFRFELTEPTLLFLQTTGTTDTYAWLMDSDCWFVRRNDDGGQGLNFRIATYLEAGVYYLDVSGYGEVATGTYQLLVSTVDDGLGVDLSINPGMNDAWFNPETPGQGFFISVYPDINYIFVSWFTFDTFQPGSDVSSNLGDPGHRWYTAAGSIYGNEAWFNIELTSGGLFNSGEAVTQEYGGSLYLRFDSCSSGIITYDIEGKELYGQIPIQRAVEDNVGVCDFLGRSANPIIADQAQSVANASRSKQSAQPENDPKQPVAVRSAGTQESILYEMNYGLNDAWYNPQWLGQGFFVTVLPDLGGIFVSWFTFDTTRPDPETPYDVGEPGHRWLTAFGYFEGNQADLNIELTQGGLFNNPEPVTQGTTGSMSIRFHDCFNATITYGLDQTGENGEIDIVRAYESPNNIFECEFPLIFSQGAE